MNINESPILFRARKLIRKHLQSIPANKIPVIALSGGADSLALAFVASLEGVKTAHIIDHGLQEVTSQVARDVAKQISAWNMTAIITRVQVNQANGAQSGGIESAARNARYEALLADENHIVFLAHTMRDQAETVLLGLARGSGSRSLQGMEEISREGRIIRPFLSLTREDMELICEQFNLSYWSDPHNESNEYTRVRIRNELLPLMEEILGGGVTEALSRTASLLQEDNASLDEYADSEYTVNAKLLANQPPALRRRNIRRFLLEANIDSSKLANVHIMGVDSLLTDWRGQKGISVPGGLVKRINNRLTYESI